MTCRCPAVPQTTAGTPIGQPLRCGCCGGVLQLTCGSCADKPAQLPAIVSAAPVWKPRPVTPAERREKALARFGVEPRPRTYQRKYCAHCQALFQPTGPKAKYCEAHVKPASRAPAA